MFLLLFQSIRIQGDNWRVGEKKETQYRSSDFLFYFRYYCIDYVSTLPRIRLEFSYGSDRSVLRCIIDNLIVEKTLIYTSRSYGSWDTVIE